MVSALEDVATLVPEAVKSDGEAREHQVHAARQVSPRCPQHQVKVIGHHRERVEVPTRAERRFMHRGQERTGRPRIHEDVGSIVAPRVDVKDRVGAFGSGWSGHVPMV